MPPTEWVSHSAEETIAIGRQIAATLQPPVIVLLCGELGAGKTTLSKGIVSGLGAAREEDVTSPTFTLVHVFHSPSGTACGATVYHVDLYRIEHPAELETLGLEDALSEPAIVLVEWPERFALPVPWPKLTIRLEHLEGDVRRIRLSPPQHP